MNVPRMELVEVEYKTRKWLVLGDHSQGKLLGRDMFNQVSEKIYGKYWSLIGYCDLIILTLSEPESNVRCFKEYSYYDMIIIIHCYD